MSETITKQTIDEITEIIQKLYLEDQIPWVIGYSGGKDSTAALQLVWNALLGLPDDKRSHKAVHVISTDTLVESPVVAAWVNLSLSRMRESALEQSLPIQVHRLTPTVQNSFWVNLIGKGYPAPRATFRWCTSRLKIEPSNRFVREVIAEHGETILILGTRKAESSNRARNMTRYEKQRIRDFLSPNASLPNSLVFSPIENWSNDDVWLYLMQVKNPWGHSNKDLLSMYRGASADGECPLVVDTNTPSCGNSRFGCWVCTLVEFDKSMAAMILNDDEKAWLAPLLEFRNEFGDMEKDRSRRDFRRMDGKILLHRDRLVHGPYTKHCREYWLRRLLQIQIQMHNNCPEEYKSLKLITDEELREIRKIWLTEKHEFDDMLPKIYLGITGEQFKYADELIEGPFGLDEWNILKKICGDDELLFELQASLLDIEQHTKIFNLQKGILDELENQIRRCYYEDENDAEHVAKFKDNQKKSIEDGRSSEEECYDN